MGSFGGKLDANRSHAVSAYNDKRERDMFKTAYKDVDQGLANFNSKLQRGMQNSMIRRHEQLEKIRNLGSNAPDLDALAIQREEAHLKEWQKILEKQKKRNKQMNKNIETQLDSVKVKKMKKKDHLDLVKENL